MGIKEIRETMESCKHCFMCRHACPTFLATKMDSHTPRGYALLLSQIDSGKLSWSPVIARRFYQCSLCGLCRQDCEYHWKEDEVVRNGREEIFKAEMVPSGAGEVIKRCLRDNNPMGLDVSVNWKKQSKGTVPDLIYIPGMLTSAKYPETAGSTAKILDSMDVARDTLPAVDYSVIPLYELGDTKEALKRKEALFLSLKRTGACTILTDSPHLLRLLKDPEFLCSVPGNDRWEILHTSQFFGEAIAKGRLKPRSFKIKAGYHDPCHLGRKMGIFEAPRKIIKAITGLAPIELFHSKEKAECCGAGGSLFLTEPSLSLEIARRRLQNAREEGVELLITACPNCRYIFTEARKEDDPEIMDLTDFIFNALEGEGFFYE